MLFKFVVILAALTVVGFAFTLDDCPSNLQKDKYLKVHGNKCYGFQVYMKKSFEDAQAYCRTQGGSLAIVKSESTNSYLKKMLSGVYGIHYSPVWVGLRFEHGNKKYRWVDGSNMGYNHLKDDTGPLSWDQCVAMSPSMRYWSTYACGHTAWSPTGTKNAFVCQYSIPQAGITATTISTGPHPNTTMTATNTDDCPTHLNRDRYLQAYGNKCYSFHVNSWKHFDEAQDYCKQDGGMLALLKSKSINNFVRDEMSKTYKEYTPIWIGLQFNLKYDTFVWLDGSALTYTNFASFVYGSSYECATMAPSDGIWDQDICKGYYGPIKKHPFVCEYPFSSTSQQKTTETIYLTATPLYVMTQQTTRHPDNSTLATMDDCHVGNRSAKNIHVFENKCYYFALDKSVSFDNAENFCESHRGKLALVKSRKINGFLQYHLTKTHKLNFFSDYVWIGLEYSKSYYGYRWLDDAPLGFTNFKYSTEQGLCVAMSPVDGKWRKEFCNSDNHTFICEFNSRNTQVATPASKTTTPPPSTKDECPMTSVNDDDVQVLGNKCFYFGIREKSTFQQASNYCASHGGQLAMVKSQRINNFLEFHLRTTQGLDYFHESLWIGLRYNDTHRGYYWVDGSEMNFNNFRYSSVYGKCMAISSSNGKWEDENCDPKYSSDSHKKGFICEFDATSTDTQSTPHETSEGLKHQ